MAPAPKPFSHQIRPKDSQQLDALAEAVLGPTLALPPSAPNIAKLFGDGLPPPPPARQPSQESGEKKLRDKAGAEKRNRLESAKIQSSPRKGPAVAWLSQRSVFNTASESTDAQTSAPYSINTAKNDHDSEKMSASAALLIDAVGGDGPPLTEAVDSLIGTMHDAVIGLSGQSDKETYKNVSVFEPTLGEVSTRLLSGTIGYEPSFENCDDDLVFPTLEEILGLSTAIWEQPRRRNNLASTEPSLDLSLDEQHITELRGIANEMPSVPEPSETEVFRPDLEICAESELASEVSDATANELKFSPVTLYEDAPPRKRRTRSPRSSIQSLATTSPARYSSILDARSAFAPSEPVNLSMYEDVDGSEIDRLHMLDELWTNLWASVGACQEKISNILDKPTKPRPVADILASVLQAKARFKGKRIGVVPLSKKNPWEISNEVIHESFYKTIDRFAQQLNLALEITNLRAALKRKTGKWVQTLKYDLLNLEAKLDADMIHDAQNHMHKTLLGLYKHDIHTCHCLMTVQQRQMLAEQFAHIGKRPCAERARKGRRYLQHRLGEVNSKMQDIQAALDRPMTAHQRRRSKHSIDSEHTHYIDAVMSDESDVEPSENSHGTLTEDSRSSQRKLSRRLVAMAKDWKELSDDSEEDESALSGALTARKAEKSFVRDTVGMKKGLKTEIRRAMAELRKNQAVGEQWQDHADKVLILRDDIRLVLQSEYNELKNGNTRMQTELFDVIRSYDPKGYKFNLLTLPELLLERDLLRKRAAAAKVMLQIRRHQDARNKRLKAMARYRRAKADLEIALRKALQEWRGDIYENYYKKWMRPKIEEKVVLDSAAEVETKKIRYEDGTIAETVNNSGTESVINVGNENVGSDKPTDGDEEKVLEEEVPHEVELLWQGEDMLDDMTKPVQTRCRTLLKQQTTYKQHLRKQVMALQSSTLFDDIDNQLAEFIKTAGEELGSFIKELTAVASSVESDMASLEKRQHLNEFAEDKKIMQGIKQFHSMMKTCLAACKHELHTMDNFVDPGGGAIAHLSEAREKVGTIASYRPFDDFEEEDVFRKEETEESEALTYKDIADALGAPSSAVSSIKRSLESWHRAFDRRDNSIKRLEKERTILFGQIARFREIKRKKLVKEVLTSEYKKKEIKSRRASAFRKIREKYFITKVHPSEKDLKAAQVELADAQDELKRVPQEIEKLCNEKKEFQERIGQLQDVLRKAKVDRLFLESECNSIMEKMERAKEDQESLQLIRKGLDIELETEERNDKRTLNDTIVLLRSICDVDQAVVANIIEEHPALKFMYDKQKQKQKDLDDTNQANLYDKLDKTLKEMTDYDPTVGASGSEEESESSSSSESAISEDWDGGMSLEEKNERKPRKAVTRKTFRKARSDIITKISSSPPKTSKRMAAAIDAANSRADHPQGHRGAIVDNATVQKPREVAMIEKVRVLAKLRVAARPKSPPRLQNAQRKKSISSMKEDPDLGLKLLRQQVRAAAKNVWQEEAAAHMAEKRLRIMSSKVMSQLPAEEQAKVKKMLENYANEGGHMREKEDLDKELAQADETIAKLTGHLEAVYKRCLDDDEDVDTFFQNQSLQSNLTNVLSTLPDSDDEDSDSSKNSSTNNEMDEHEHARLLWTNAKDRMLRGTTDTLSRHKRKTSRVACIIRNFTKAPPPVESFLGKIEPRKAELTRQEEREKLRLEAQKKALKEAMQLRKEKMIAAKEKTQAREDAISAAMNLQDEAQRQEALDSLLTYVPRWEETRTIETACFKTSNVRRKILQACQKRGFIREFSNIPRSNTAKNLKDIVDQIDGDHDLRNLKPVGKSGSSAKVGSLGRESECDAEVVADAVAESHPQDILIDSNHEDQLLRARDACDPSRQQMQHLENHRAVGSSDVLRAPKKITFGIIGTSVFFTTLAKPNPALSTTSANPPPTPRSTSPNSERRLSIASGFGATRSSVKQVEQEDTHENTRRRFFTRSFTRNLLQDKFDDKPVIKPPKREPLDVFVHEFIGRCGAVYCRRTDFIRRRPVPGEGVLWVLRELRSDPSQDGSLGRNVRLRWYAPDDIAKKISSASDVNYCMITRIEVDGPRKVLLHFQLSEEAGATQQLFLSRIYWEGGSALPSEFQAADQSFFANKESSDSKDGAGPKETSCVREGALLYLNLPIGRALTFSFGNSGDFSEIPIVPPPQLPDRCLGKGPGRKTSNSRTGDIIELRRSLARAAHAVEMRSLLAFAEDDLIPLPESIRGKAIRMKKRLGKHFSKLVRLKKDMLNPRLTEGCLKKKQGGDEKTNENVGARNVRWGGTEVATVLVQEDDHEVKEVAVEASKSIKPNVLQWSYVLPQMNRMLLATPEQEEQDALNHIGVENRSVLPMRGASPVSETDSFHESTRNASPAGEAHSDLVVRSTSDFVGEKQSIGTARTGKTYGSPNKRLSCIPLTEATIKDLSSPSRYIDLDGLVATLSESVDVPLQTLGRTHSADKSVANLAETSEPESLSLNPSPELPRDTSIELQKLVDCSNPSASPSHAVGPSDDDMSEDMRLGSVQSLDTIEREAGQVESPIDESLFLIEGASGELVANRTDGHLLDALAPDRPSSSGHLVKLGRLRLGRKSREGISASPRSRTPILPQIVIAAGTIEESQRLTSRFVGAPSGRAGRCASLLAQATAAVQTAKKDVPVFLSEAPLCADGVQLLSKAPANHGEEAEASASPIKTNLLDGEDLQVRTYPSDEDEEAAERMIDISKSHNVANDYLSRATTIDNLAISGVEVSLTDRRAKTNTPRPRYQQQGHQFEQILDDNFHELQTVDSANSDIGFDAPRTEPDNVTSPRDLTKKLSVGFADTSTLKIDDGVVEENLVEHSEHESKLDTTVSSVSVRDEKFGSFSVLNDILDCDIDAVADLVDTYSHDLQLSSVNKVLDCISPGDSVTPSCRRHLWSSSDVNADVFPISARPLSSPRGADSRLGWRSATPETQRPRSQQQVHKVPLSEFSSGSCVDRPSTSMGLMRPPITPGSATTSRAATPLPLIREGTATATPPYLLGGGVAIRLSDKFAPVRADEVEEFKPADVTRPSTASGTSRRPMKNQCVDRSPRSQSGMGVHHGASMIAGHWQGSTATAYLQGRFGASTPRKIGARYEASSATTTPTRQLGQLLSGIR